MNFQLALLTFLISLSYQSNFQTVAIIGTNDIHGGAFPTSMFNSLTKQTYKYGGLEFMADMIETIKKEYNGNVLYLDAGDQFQGGIEASSLVSSGQIMNDFYNVLKIDGSAIGNHQFDFGPNFLFPYWQGRSKTSSNLAANLKSQKGDQNFLPLQKGSSIYTLNSGIKIGVIGLSTMETPSSTAGFTSHLFPDYIFQEYVEIVLHQSKKLRSAGVNAVLILSHVGNQCNADSTFGIWDQSTIQTSFCSSTDQISQLIARLPTGTIDGVVQGHRHRFSHHYIRRVPVIGTINGGYYFNILYLKFYNKQIYDTSIQGPIPVCEKIFSNQGQCHYLPPQQLSTAGNLQNWKFHGQTVKVHPQLNKIFTQRWLPLMDKFLQELVKNNEIVLEKIFDRQNDLGNLITNLMNSACPGNDFVITNAGGFRTTWFPGIIQYQHFYNMFPFANTLVSFEISGKELIDVLTIVQSGKDGFYPTYGLKQTVSLAGNGTRRFIKATFSDGSEIEPTKNYKGLSLKFLMDGGDDFKDIKQVYQIRQEKDQGQFREKIKPQLMKIQTIGPDQLVNPLKPRLIVLPV